MASNILGIATVHSTNLVSLRYAAILFKKQRYVSGQHKVNLKIVCKENFKYEVQEKSPANQAVTMQQLAEEYWRYHHHHRALPEVNLELSNEEKTICTNLSVPAIIGLLTRLH